MKLFTFLFCMITFNIYSQADLTVDLFLHDSYTPPYGGSATISFGLDSGATNGIDPQLGEVQFPPDICPSWWPFFCAKFILPPFDGSLDSPKDFRFGELPYSGQITHSIFVVTADSSVTMHYNLPPGVSINLVDPLGGVLYNFFFEDSGEINIPYIYIFNQFWMYVNYDNVIPVQINSFTGEYFAKGNSVQLSWTTASETNNKGFEIEKATENDNTNKFCYCGNNFDWIKVGFVPGNGTTTKSNSYSFIDKDIINGIYKYRLKQIDFDGTFGFSNELDIKVRLTPKEFVLYQNYPNPFNPGTAIEFSLPKNVKNVNVSIYNVLGQKVAELVNGSMLAGKYQYEWNAKDYASGIYIYELKTEDFSAVKKMLLLK